MQFEEVSRALRCLDEVAHADAIKFFAVPVVVSERNGLRDQAVRALAAMLGGNSQSARAVTVAQAVRRYAAGAWKVDQGEIVPSGDDRRRWLHRVIKFNRGLPLSERQIRRVLSYNQQKL